MPLGMSSWLGTSNTNDAPDSLAEQVARTAPEDWYKDSALAERIAQLEKLMTIRILESPCRPIPEDFPAMANINLDALWKALADEREERHLAQSTVLKSIGALNLEPKLEELASKVSGAVFQKTSAQDAKMEALKAQLEAIVRDVNSKQQEQNDLLLRSVQDLEARVSSLQAKTEEGIQSCFEGAWAKLQEEQALVESASGATLWNRALEQGFADCDNSAQVESNHGPLWQMVGSRPDASEMSQLEKKSEAVHTEWRSVLDEERVSSCLSASSKDRIAIPPTLSKQDGDSPCDSNADAASLQALTETTIRFESLFSDVLANARRNYDSLHLEVETVREELQKLAAEDVHDMQGNVHRLVFQGAGLRRDLDALAAQCGAVLPEQAQERKQGDQRCLEMLQASEARVKDSPENLKAGSKALSGGWERRKVQEDTRAQGSPLVEQLLSRLHERGDSSDASTERQSLDAKLDGSFKIGEEFGPELEKPTSHLVSHSKDGSAELSDTSVTSASTQQTLPMLPIFQQAVESCRTPPHSRTKAAEVVDPMVVAPRSLGDSSASVTAPSMPLSTPRSRADSAASGANTSLATRTHVWAPGSLGLSVEVAAGEAPSHPAPGRLLAHSVEVAPAQVHSRLRSPRAGPSRMSSPGTRRERQAVQSPSRTSSSGPLADRQAARTPVAMRSPLLSSRVSPERPKRISAAVEVASVHPRMAVAIPGSPQTVVRRLSTIDPARAVTPVIQTRTSIPTTLPGRSLGVPSAREVHGRGLAMQPSVMGSSGGLSAANAKNAQPWSW